MKSFSICFSVIVGTCLLFSGCDLTKTTTDAKPGDVIEEAKDLTKSWGDFGGNNLKRNDNLENLSKDPSAGMGNKSKKK